MSSPAVGTLIAVVNGSTMSLLGHLRNVTPEDLRYAANVCGLEDVTALMLAAHLGTEGVLTLLLRAGADVNQHNTFGSTALMRAAEAGHLGIVQQLVDAGADPSAVNQGGWSVLMAAVTAGHFGVAQVLVSAGAALNAVNYADNHTALMMATWKGFAEIVQLLVSAGADISIRGKPGETAYHIALQRGAADGCTHVLREAQQAHATHYQAPMRNSEPFLAPVSASAAGSQQQFWPTAPPYSTSNDASGRSVVPVFSAPCEPPPPRFLQQQVLLAADLPRGNAPAAAAAAAAHTSQCIAPSPREQPPMTELALAYRAADARNSEVSSSPAPGAVAHSTCPAAGNGAGEPAPVSAETIGPPTTKVYEILTGPPPPVVRQSPSITKSAAEAAAKATAKAAAKAARAEMKAAKLAKAAPAKAPGVTTTAKGSAKTKKNGKTVEQHACLVPDEDEENAIFVAAAADDNHYKVQRMILAGHDVNCRSGKQDSALMMAASHGHLELMTMLLRFGADPAATSRDGSNALMKAVCNGHSAVVAMLLQAGVDVNTQNENGFTALLNTARAGNAEIVGMLLGGGADVNARNKVGDTALSVAARHGHAEVVQMLRAAGAQSVAGFKCGRTAPMAAADNGNDRTIALHNRHRRELSSRNKGDVRALTLADRSGHLKCIEDCNTSFLLPDQSSTSLQPMPNPQGDQGCTAPQVGPSNEDADDLDDSADEQGMNSHTAGTGAELTREDFESKKAWKAYCTTKRKAERQTMFPTYVKCGDARRVRKALLEKQDRANLRCPEEGDITMLMIAARCGSALMVGTLLRAGAEVNAVAQDGSTALMEAAHHGQLSAAKLLVQYGADVAVANQNGDAALMRSLQGARSILMVRLLLNASASVDVTNNAGETPLAVATRQGDADIVKLLQAATASLDVLIATKDPSAQRDVDNIGVRKAFATSLEEGLVQEVDRLLRCGVDPNVELDEGGTTALHIAAKKGSVPIVQRLLEAGADPRISSVSGQTPLMSCIFSRSLETLELLLAAGADVNACKETGETALMIASNTDMTFPHVKLLLEAGADVHVLSKTHRTALSIAVLRGVAPTVDALLQAGAELSRHSWKMIRGTVDNTLLMWAAAAGGKSLAVRLVTEGADPHEQNLAGLSAMDLAKTDKVRSAMRSAVAGKIPVPRLSKKDRKAQQLMLAEKTGPADFGEMLPSRDTWPSAGSSFGADVPLAGFERPVGAAGTSAKDEVDFPESEGTSSGTHIPAGASWLALRLSDLGLGSELIALCDTALVRGQGFFTARGFARMPPEKFTEDFLRRAGITAEGLVYELLELHGDLREKYHPPTQDGRVGRDEEDERGEAAAERSREMVARLLRGGGAPSATSAQPPVQEPESAAPPTASVRNPPAGAHWQPLYARTIATSASSAGDH